MSGKRAYRWGVAMACVTSFLIVWTTIVRDDGNGIGFFMVVIAAMVSAAAAGCRPMGMARAMLGLAIMQELLGIAVATQPSTMRVPDGSFRVLLSAGAFILLWLASAALFRLAARQAVDCGHTGAASTPAP